jgi:predicted RNA-binding protein YlxR (DUF448 family)
VSAPIRTCVGCRARDEQARLVRIAIAGGRAIPDPGRRRPGRGLYVHPRTECVDRAVRGGGIARGLRAPLSVDDAAAVRALPGPIVGGT